MRKKVALIIPTVYLEDNTNLIRCIKSIIHSSRKVKNIKTYIIISVNGSPSKSGNEHVAKLKEKTKAELYFVFSNKPLGFSISVNKGITYIKRKADPDWYLTLNDDIFLHLNYFKYFYRYIKSGAFDMLSCKIMSADGRLQSVGLTYQKTGIANLRKKDITKKDIPLIPGGATLVSRETVIQQLKNYGYFFNPFYFIYAEDLELSIRVLNSGGKLFISNTPLLTHIGSQTIDNYPRCYFSYRNWIVTIILLWPPNIIIKNTFYLVAGQIYIFFESLRQGYFLLYIKIWIDIISNGPMLIRKREKYLKQMKVNSLFYIFS